MKSLNESCATMRDCVANIVTICGGLDVVTSTAVMRNVKQISEMLDVIQPSSEREVPYGLAVEGRLEDDDGVSGSRKELRELRDEAGSEGKGKVHERVRRAIAQAEKARSRARNRRRRRRVRR